jgi:hypothetical protein
MNHSEEHARLGTEHPRLCGSETKPVGTAVFGCPAEQRSAILFAFGGMLSSFARLDSRGRLSHVAADGCRASGGARAYIT